VKKLNVILLILSFILSGIGGIFLFDAKISNNDSIQTIAPSNKIESEEITEYTYKTYEDYFIDNFNLPAETYTRDETTNVVTIDYTKITRNTTNGQTELSYNGNVFDVVTSDDLSGSGSQSDPYIVHSTKGFLYLTNNAFSKKALATKFLELNCDINLNDEKFDKDGNSYGGDGTVYKWLPIKNEADELSVNGNGYHVKGLFIMDDTISYVGLFGPYNNRRLNLIKDLTMDNFFILGKNYVTSIATHARSVINCHTQNGFICGNNTVAGITVDISKEIKDSINNATVKTKTTQVGGIIVMHTSTVEVINCKNFGDLYCTSGRAGGICENTSGKLKIVNCANYGKIICVSGASRIGGIVGLCSGGNVIIKNSINNGIITSENAGNLGQSGGIIGFAEGDIVLMNVKSYGDLNYMTGCGHIIGYLASRLYSEHTKLEMEDILVDSSTCLALVGGTDKANDTKDRDVTIIAHEIQINLRKNPTSTTYLFIYGISCPKTFVDIKNVVINSNVSNKVSIYLFSKLNKKETKILLQNIIMHNHSSDKEVKLSSDAILAVFDYQGVLFNYDIKPALNSYYGTDFSGFYFAWRTGKVGLVALDGRGQFQGTIDEEWLKGKGYEKKSA